MQALLPIVGVGSSHRFVLTLLILLLTASCKKPYRVGEHVWIEIDGRKYSAYIKEKRSRTRLLVHFDGCNSQSEEQIHADKVVARIEGTPQGVGECPQDRKQKLAVGAASAKVVTEHKVGARVKVRWRGSIYPASIVGVVARNRYLVHYDGHDNAWDEEVGVERIVTSRK